MNRHPVSWMLVNENEAAWQAVSRVQQCIQQGGKGRPINPLYLHGPTGTGKTHLLMHLREQVGGMVWSAGDWNTGEDASPLPTDSLAELPGVVPGVLPGVLLVDDLHRFPPRADETLVGLVDRCLVRPLQLVVTATVGPALLPNASRRLASRLASGLVVGLQPLGLESRRVALERAAQHRSLSLGDEVLQFLAAKLPGSFRALEGALNRLETLGPRPSLQAVRTLLDADSTPRTASEALERIIARVCDYFQVPANDLRSARRSRQVMVPRQVSMYLARQFTDLSLVAIGEHLGGRDHSTVLHACRKIEEDLQNDANLCRAVRELAAGLAGGC
jgi:chromosomal replication initiator protein